METTDLSSVLGIAGGVSASVLIVCVAIALTTRFRRHHRAPSNSTQHHAHGIQHSVDKSKKTDNQPYDLDADPDVIINSQLGNNVITTALLTFAFCIIRANFV